MIVLASSVQPRSEGEILLTSSDPAVHPDIRMNYFDDPHDLNVMTVIIRTALEIVANWPQVGGIGPLLVPPALADKHGHAAGDEPSDALIQDLALHYAWSVYHLTSTCRIGAVVDERLRVSGVANLRVADASVMPNIVSGNTNAAAIMIGEKAAEMIAADHGLQLEEFVGPEF
jgi:choline dehydrogenase-like flavoprotein